MRTSGPRRQHWPGTGSPDGPSPGRSRVGSDRPARTGRVRQAGADRPGPTGRRGQAAEGERSSSGRSAGSLGRRHGGANERRAAYRRIMATAPWRAAQPSLAPCRPVDVLPRRTSGARRQPVRLAGVSDDRSTPWSVLESGSEDAPDGTVGWLRRHPEPHWHVRGTIGVVPVADGTPLSLREERRRDRTETGRGWRGRARVLVRYRLRHDPLSRQRRA